MVIVLAPRRLPGLADANKAPAIDLQSTPWWLENLRSSARRIADLSAGEISSSGTHCSLRILGSTRISWITRPCRSSSSASEAAKAPRTSANEGMRAAVRLRKPKTLRMPPVATRTATPARTRCRCVIPAFLDELVQSDEAVSKPTMRRAFSPWEPCHSFTWRVAPGCYESGLRPSGPHSNHHLERSAEGALLYQPGAKPRVCIHEQESRAEGPLHRVSRQVRQTGPAFIAL